MKRVFDSEWTRRLCGEEIARWLLLSYERYFLDSSSPQANPTMGDRREEVCPPCCLAVSLTMNTNSTLLLETAQLIHLSVSLQHTTAVVALRL
jgi:hypothetical protein